MYIDKQSECLNSTHLMATLLPSITTGLKLLVWYLSSGVGLRAGDTVRGGLHPRATSCGLLLEALEVLAAPEGTPLAPHCPLALVYVGTVLLVLFWQVLMSSSRMSLVWASWRRLSSTRMMSAWE